MNTTNPNTNTGNTTNHYPYNTEKWVEEVFTWHTPTENQIPKYEKLREGAKTFATLLISVTPAGPDQSAALRHIREAVMTANAAIALDGKTFA